MSGRFTGQTEILEKSLLSCSQPFRRTISDFWIADSLLKSLEKALILFPFYTIIAKFGLHTFFFYKIEYFIFF